MAYGSKERPVSLDHFQTIVGVKWKGKYTVKDWRVDYTYRSYKRLAGEFYTAVVRLYDPADTINTSFPTTIAQATPAFLDAAIAWGAPWFEGEAAQVTVSRTSIVATATYGYVSGLPVAQASGPYTYQDVRFWAQRPAREGIANSGSKLFITRTQAEENNLQITVKSWWIVFQNNLILNGFEQSYGNFVRGEPYRVT